MFEYAEPHRKHMEQNVLQKKETDKLIAAPNHTGIPDYMKTQFESLSGLSFDDVHVHYNSYKPAHLQALAYTQNNQVYIGPGQEKHLRHELWHVVQQKQGRVESNAEINGEALNNDAALEMEAESVPAKINGLYSNKDYLKSGKSTDTVQRYYDVKPYHYGDHSRKLYATGNENTIPQPDEDAERTDGIGILYEMICTRGQENAIIGRFNGLFPNGQERNDVGLSIVVNAPRPAGHETVSNPNQGQLGHISDRNTQINPFIHVEKLAWGYSNTGTPLVAPTGGWGAYVPFLELRKRAADNPGARKIHNILDANCSSVWRRMGDDDMAFINPASNENLHIKKLKALEDKKMVTFAYNLKSDPEKYTAAYTGAAVGFTQAERLVINTRIELILQSLYQKESKLRNKLTNEVGIGIGGRVPGSTMAANSRFVTAEIYPSEPTTFYKAETGKHSNILNQQQIKEGASIKTGLNIDSHKYVAKPATIIDTNAGNRNNAIINALVASCQRVTNQFRFTITQGAFIDCVTILDQSYFNPGNATAFHLNANEKAEYKAFVREFLHGFYTNFLSATFP